MRHGVIFFSHFHGSYMYRAHSRFAPSQWEMALLCGDVSCWLAAKLESALYVSVNWAITGLERCCLQLILSSHYLSQCDILNCKTSWECQQFVNLLRFGCFHTQKYHNSRHVKIGDNHAPVLGKIRVKLLMLINIMVSNLPEAICNDHIFGWLAIYDLNCLNPVDLADTRLRTVAPLTNMD